jgi:hypothetical protein
MVSLRFRKHCLGKIDSVGLIKVLELRRMFITFERFLGFGLEREEFWQDAWSTETGTVWAPLSGRSCKADGRLYS